MFLESRFSKTFIVLFNLFALSVFSFTLYVDFVSFNLGIRSSNNYFGGRLRFLTFWNVLIQFLYFAISSARSIQFMFSKTSPSSSSSSYSESKTWNLFSAAIAFPTSFFVGSTFWILYSIDRELIYPKHLDNYLPFWFNHLLHSVTIPFMVADRFLIRTNYPEFKKGLSIVLAFMATYLIWLLIASYISGIWVYPIFEVLDWTKKIIFVVICAVVFLGSYTIGHFMNKLFWGPRQPIETTRVIKAS